MLVSMGTTVVQLTACSISQSVVSVSLSELHTMSCISLLCLCDHLCCVCRTSPQATDVWLHSSRLDLDTQGTLLTCRKLQRFEEVAQWSECVTVRIDCMACSAN